MKTKAFLQKTNGEWFDDFVYTAIQPLINRGIKIIPFNENSVHKIHPLPNDILVGSVESTKIFWDKLGITPPKYIGYPTKLRKYLGRYVTTAKFIDVEDMCFPLFIKPKEEIKLFTGFVIEDEKQYANCKFLYPEITDDLELYISEPINILSEYRCFVHKGVIVGIKHYSGDFRLFLDVDVIKQMVLDYTCAPISYTLDVAITDNSSCVLVEVNDFWAIGGYGLDGKTYVRMLIDRFQQIKNTPY